MSDLIREARDYLAGLIEKSDALNPAPWAVEDGPGDSAIVGPTKNPITWDDHAGEVFEDPTAHLIVALRAAAPLILDELGRVVREMDYRPWLAPPEWAMRLSIVILATKRVGDE